MGFICFLEAWFFGKSKYPQTFYVFRSPSFRYFQFATWYLMRGASLKKADFGKQSMAARGRLSIYCCRSLASLT